MKIIAASAARVRCPPERALSGVSGAAFSPAPSERFGKARLKCPVRRLQGVRVPRFGAAQVCERRADLEQAGNRSPPSPPTFWRSTPSLPHTETLPAVGDRRPLMRFSSVDLPTPFWPTSPMRS